MQVKKILRDKQPEVLRKLNRKRKQRKKERKERLSFYDIRKLMEAGRVYKRTKGGAWRQVR